MGISIDWTSPALIASLVAALMATLGLVTVRLNGAFSERFGGYFSAFAAGVLVMTALRLFPEGLEITRLAPYWVAAGYLTLFVLNTLLRHDGDSGGLVIAPLIGIGLHSFLDGIEYGILFKHDLFIGILASLGLVLHEFAEGMILFALLRTAGLKPGPSVVAAFFGAALTTPLGAIISTEFLDTAPEEALGILISLASGALLYVGATHLTVHIANANRYYAVLNFCLGAAVALGLSFAHYAVHGDHDHEGAAHMHEASGHAPDHDNDHDHDHDDDAAGEDMHR